jgi:hypothetical protein
MEIPLAQSRCSENGSTEERAAFHRDEPPLLPNRLPEDQRVSAGLAYPPRGNDLERRLEKESKNTIKKKGLCPYKKNTQEKPLDRRG